MSFDLDQYYTPMDVALRVLERSTASRMPGVCTDTTCGRGSLLEASQVVFRAHHCIGIDSDRAAIAALRRRRPTWTLSVADLLNSQSCLKSRAVRESAASNTDMLVLNPPFSQQGRKYLQVSYKDEILKVSVAMAYILRSLELFNPRLGAIAIVPESLLHADVDSSARCVLERKFKLLELLQLDSTTFRGARARAVAIEFHPSSESVKKIISKHVASDFSVKVTRGSLPVHIAELASGRIPYIHSTDIRPLLDGWGRPARTGLTAKGNIKGWTVLLPRVGVPHRRQVEPFFFEKNVQLSDCVIALECSAHEVAIGVAKRIKSNWEDFIGIYRGTGARYITVARLMVWLKRFGIDGLV